ncbi:helix-turn-helix domain-containing protein [Streptomyces abikoensis]|uniref:helix-turn-helix domain-containing protein n=1 Tax=Streptomyces abikoensis TaxID=97398 RepID=UPI0033C86036
MIEGNLSRVSLCRDELGDDPVVRNRLAEGATVRMTEIVCFEDQRSFRPTVSATVRDTPQLTVLLVRAGGFLLRKNGHEEFIDPTTCFVLRQGDETSVSHPVHASEVSTLLEISWDLYDDALPLGVSPGVPVTADLDLSHRSLISVCRVGVDQFEVSERVQDLLAKMSGQLGPVSTGRRAPTVVAHRRLVNEVRAILNDGPLTKSLEELSHRAACSPTHLSRVFRLVTGQTLTSYRNQLRVRGVIEELVAGQSLRVLAAKYGFTDQAHMTRVFRQHAGEVPTAVRAMLQPTVEPRER